ncbi:MAG: hypothetical protein M3Y03_02135 [Verrucomicrobiota bacterium]|nr:hypothetical protein [Verrucomicrobiota bacterium]
MEGAPRLGWCDFIRPRAAQNVATLLQSLSRESHGFSFDASDVTATPIFADT